MLSRRDGFLAAVLGVAPFSVPVAGAAWAAEAGVATAAATGTVPTEALAWALSGVVLTVRTGLFAGATFGGAETAVLLTSGTSFAGVTAAGGVAAVVVRGGWAAGVVVTGATGSAFAGVTTAGGAAGAVARGWIVGVVATGTTTGNSGLVAAEPRFRRIVFFGAGFAGAASSPESSAFDFAVAALAVPGVSAGVLSAGLWGGRLRQVAAERHT